MPRGLLISMLILLSLGLFATSSAAEGPAAPRAARPGPPIPPLRVLEFRDLPATPSRPARVVKRGSLRRVRAAGAASASADQRAIQAVMDAHASEVDECAGQADDASGEVALLLSISSDGRPMGVVIERAPQNLKEVGECVRQHALRWRFPASHGVVTARQSLSFGP